MGIDLGVAWMLLISKNEASISEGEIRHLAKQPVKRGYSPVVEFAEKGL